MKITVKTAGLLGQYLPPGSGNLAELDVADDATPVDVMRQLGMPMNGTYLVSLNGKVVPTAEREKTTLTESDSLAIMPPLKGG